MGSQPNPSPKVLFGPFEFEHLSGDLRKFGNRIRLQGKPLQILSILLGQPGQVFSRDELQRHLWQGTTFVDFEQGLNTAVNKLRQALGDSADQPRYIETVPGKGYRFIAPLHRPSVKTVLEMAPPASLRLKPQPRAKRKLWPLLGACAAVTSIGSGLWFVTTRPEPAVIAKPARFAVTAPAGFVLEAAGATRQSFALSPDGTHLAFTAMATNGAFSVFVRDFNSLEPRLLPGSEGVHTLFWASDSRSLFLTVNGKVQRAPLEGDARVVLGESPGFLLSGAWMSPERLLLGSILASYSIPPSGGPLETLKEVYRWPQLLPDGKHILYVTWDERNHRHRARVARFNDPDSAKDLIEADSRVLYTASLANPGAGYLMYVRAGNLLAQPFDPRSLRVSGEAIPVLNKVYSFRPTGGADFSVSNSGTLAFQSFASRSQLVWVDRQGRQVGSASPANANLESGRLSADGRKLATAIYDVERGGQNLWIVDLESNAARELTLDPGLRDAPIWSPDSKRLGFLYARPGKRPQVRLRGTGENDIEEGLGSEAFQMPSDWSPDGRFIVFANTGIARRAGEIQSDVFLFDLAHGRQVVPVLTTPFHEGNAAFTPDGKWLTFTSNESGRTEVYVQAFESTPTPRVTGERHLVTRSGAQALRWRRDGKELFYLSFDGRVYGVPAKLSPKPEFGPATPLFTIAPEARAAIHSVLAFDVSPDGQRFLIPVVNSQPGPALVVMQNWEASLPQRRLGDTGRE
jgi:DNA-binding winged helix-turn-helix (wHTH) protein